MGRLSGRLVGLLVGSTSLLALASPASAISVTGSSSAGDLLTALGATGLLNVTASLSNQSSGGALSSGTFTNASGTYSIGPGIVLSSGDVNHYNDGPNSTGSNTTNFGVAATPAQELMLDQITGGSLSHFDVSQFNLTFDVDDDTSSVFFNVVFGSEEFAEWVGSSFIDAFGIFLNGVNIAVFDGLPVNIDHPDMAFLAGTQLDGVLDPSGNGSNPVMLFSGSVTPGSTGNELIFIIADSGDSALDSTAYISGFGNVNPGGGNPGGGTGETGNNETDVPAPAALTLFGLGLMGLGIGRRRR